MVTAKIIIPCYNEEERLDVFRFAEFSDYPHDITFLFVNDGSTDRTLSVLETLRRGNPNKFCVLNLPQNCGKAEAVRRGLLMVIQENPKYVGFWDADLATPLEAITDFVSFAETHPDLALVMGSRVRLLGRRVERRASRHYLGRIFATAVSVILNLPVYDTQCGAKLFRVSPVIRNLLDRPFCSRWFFDVEVIARLAQASNAGKIQELEKLIYEYPLAEWRDIAGSKLRYPDFMRASWDLLRIWLKYPRYGRKSEQMRLNMC